MFSNGLDVFHISHLLLDRAENVRALGDEGGTKLARIGVKLLLQLTHAGGADRDRCRAFP